MTEAVDHPDHYNAHPSGIECIDVVEHMSFNIGNAVKYLWRADEKGAAEEDLRKAAWYIARELETRASVAASTLCCCGQPEAAHTPTALGACTYRRASTCSAHTH